MIGRTISHYKILSKLGEGGMGVVYKAEDLTLGRTVALKFLPPDSVAREEDRARLVHEARAAAALLHPNICPIHEIAEAEGRIFIAMACIEGRSLKDRIAQGPLPLDEALSIARQIGDALAAAHAKGIIHRDIKPGNVMLTRMGKVKITDFGLAKLAHGQIQQTAANSILGTPLYMSPEQAFGETVDQRSDLFSLGTVLYEALTGHQPYEGDNYMGVIQNIIHQNAPKPSRFGIDLPPGVEAILVKSMHKNRDSRFQSARDFRQAIEKHMGLDALSQATECLKTLLAADGATMLLPKTERARTQKKRLKKSVAVAFIVGGVAGLAAIGYFYAPDTMREQIAQVLPRRDATPASRAASGENDLFAAGVTDGFAPAGFPLDEPTNTGTLANEAVPEDSAAELSGATIDSTMTRNEAAPSPPANALSEQPTAAREPGDGETPRDAEPSADSGKTHAVEKTGWLSVTTEPAADVYVDGRFIGDTPRYRVELLSGSHTLECLSPNHEPYIEELNIATGELSSRNIVMAKLVGEISLSTIEGAEVYLDEVFVGSTPLREPIEVEAGRHQLTVKKAGYHVWNNSVAVDSRQTLTLKITLSTIY
jgi:predicted Ser/Thr protein kinase